MAGESRAVRELDEAEEHAEHMVRLALTALDRDDPGTAGVYATLAVRAELRALGNALLIGLDH